MRCITPMVRIYDARSSEIKKLTGSDEKIYQRIVPRSQVYDRLSQDNNYLRKLREKNEEMEKKGSPLRYQLIPCRNCYACQLKYSAEWATRLTWECREHPDYNFFLTITYDEEHVPIYEKFRYTDEDGQTKIFENDGTWNGTLEPEDITRFIKSLRKGYERKEHTGIKYFYCGEYGDTTKRPHYHMILMNCPLDIKKFYDFHIDPKHKKMHWKSKELDKLWGKGMIDIAEVEWNCCAYVARYCMKKLSFKDQYTKKEYAENGKLPEFVRMSLRPGIGMKYYNEHKKDIYQYDSVVQKTIQGNVSVFKPPKAFDKKFKEEYPDQWEKILESREAAADRNQKMIEDLQKGISDLELLQRDAEKTITKANLLKRIVNFE